MKRKHSGFTLVELLVVITIISILMGLLIPAVNSAREVMRKAECGVNIKNLALAAFQYEGAKGSFPGWVEKYGVFPGGRDRSDLFNYGGSVPRHVKVGGFGVALLPWLDAQPTYEHWTDDSYPVIADGANPQSLGTTGAVGVSNAGAGFHNLAAPNLGNFQCASNPVTDANAGRNSYITNNGMCYTRTSRAASGEPTWAVPGNGGAAGFTATFKRAQRVDNGIFKAKYIGINLPSPDPLQHVVGPKVSMDDLKDGKTNTALFSENVQALPWYLPGFLNGLGLQVGTGVVDLNYSVVNTVGLGELNSSQFTAGMVWHFEDPQATLLNGLSPAVVSPSPFGRNVGSEAFTIHRINGAGGNAPSDKFVLQMTIGNAPDLARPSSAHVDGVNMGFADGATRFVSESVDTRVYQAMMTPRGKSSDVPWPEFVLTEEVQ